MKDFLGRELALGDEVVMMVPRYRQIMRGKIIKFTPQMVRVEYGTPKSWLKGACENVLQTPDQIVKIV